MKTSTSTVISRLFLVSWLIALAACRGTSFPAAKIPPSTTDTTSIVTAAAATIYAQMTETSTVRTSTLVPSATYSVSPTASLTATPEPTFQPAEHLQPLSGQSGPGVVIVSKGKPPTFLLPKGTLPNQHGDYVIYRTLNGSIGYISIDGSVKGNLLGNKNMMAGLPDFLMTSNRSSPTLVFVSEASPDKYIWITDLTGKPVKGWHVQEEDKFYCTRSLISPGGNWMVIFCTPKQIIGKLYLNLINLESGGERVIPTPCTGGESPISIGWAEAKWSEDEERFSFWCRYRHYYCFISTYDGEGICKDFQKSIRSISPDWTKAVLDLGDMPNATDGAKTGIRALIADMRCVLEESNCNQGVVVDFPYHQKTPDTLYSSVNILWSKSGQSFAWMNTAYRRDGTTGVLEDTSCGWIDLESNTSQQLCRNATEGTKLVAISPDERWLLFKDEHSLYWVSISQEVVRHLVVDLYDPDFYGWLTIP